MREFSKENLIIFPENIEDNIPEIKIDLTPLNIYQKKIIKEAQKMYISKEYVYIYGGGHREDIKTNYSFPLTKQNMKNAGYPVRNIGKYSYEIKPEFYDNLNWDKNQIYNGLDCSGFIYCCFNKAGIKIKCSIATCYPLNPNFKIIKYNELLPGDIISYKGHCLIYLGKIILDKVENFICIHQHNSGTFLRTGYYKVNNCIPLRYIDYIKDIDYYTFFDLLFFYLNYDKFMNVNALSFLQSGINLFKQYFDMLLQQKNANGIFNIYINCFVPLINAIIQSSSVELKEEDCVLNKETMNLLINKERNNKLLQIVIEKEKFLVEKLEYINQLIQEKNPEEMLRQCLIIVRQTIG
jgi:hypothetical protein